MSFHGYPIFWSRIQSRFTLYCFIYPPESLLIKNSPLTSYFLSWHWPFWRIQANWSWRMSPILKLSECFPMIRSELNIVAENATLVILSTSASSHQGPIKLMPSLITFLWWCSPISSRQGCIFLLWRASNIWVVLWVYRNHMLSNSLPPMVLLSIDDLCVSQYRGATKWWLF